MRSPQSGEEVAEGHNHHKDTNNTEIREGI
jgi:hypothetical protein